MTAANTLNTHPTAPLECEIELNRAPVVCESQQHFVTKDSRFTLKSTLNSCIAHTDKIKKNEKKINFGQYASSQKGLSNSPW